MPTDVAPRGPVPPKEDWAFSVAGDEARCPCDHPRRPGHRCNALIEIVLPGWALKLRALRKTEDRRAVVGTGIRVCKNGHELVAVSMPLGSNAA